MGETRQAETKETTLDSGQIAVAKKIVTAGLAGCQSIETINFAVKAAFLESSLGKFNSNGIAGNTSSGLYQYNDDQWAVSGAGGSRTSNDDQISAFYNDVRKYTNRYNSLLKSAPALLQGITVYQYIYIKHHDGTNYTKFATAPGRMLLDGSTFAPPKDARIDSITECATQ